jgi:hypothetical protein
MTGDLLDAWHHLRVAQPKSRARLNRWAPASAPALALIHRRCRCKRAAIALQEAFTIFADVVRNPAFANEELDRAKSEALDGLQVALSQPGSHCGLCDDARDLWHGALRRDRFAHQHRRHHAR